MKNIYKLLFIIFFLINNLFALNEVDNTSYINTKNITYNEIDQIIELGENSLINIKDTNILTNKGIIDYKNNKIELFGDLYIYQDKNILSAQDLKGDIKLENFKANSVSYIYNDDLKIDSTIMQRNQNKIFFYDNFMTPCKLNGYFNCPTWSLKIPKTLYLIDKDQFKHYDSFLQIADKKVFYLPYFSHYGTKADRQKGFLLPSFDFNLIRGISSIQTPYYLPFNTSTDLEITPRFNLDTSNNGSLNDNLELKTKLSNKRQGGEIDIYSINRINNFNSDIYSSVSIETYQTINKNNNFEIKSLLTNSISNSRSDNEKELSSFENYIKTNSYNVFKKNDILTAEVNTVTSFDESQNSLIPYQAPFINYLNQSKINKNNFLNNDLNFYILERSDSNSNNPNRNISLNMTNELVNQINFKSNYLTNKVIFDNSYRDLEYANSRLNSNFNQSSLRLSSNFDNFIFNNSISQQLKFIINEDFNTYNHNFNEDSNSVTFNYHHLFNENRFLGSDMSDNSKRIVYGFGVENKFNDKNINLNIGQSYDFTKNNRYLEKINQQKNLSDIAVTSAIDITDDILFEIDLRLDNANYTKKEFNYSILTSKPTHILIEYNETSKNAFFERSNNTKSIEAEIGYDLNQNVNINFNTNIDLKDDYSPYKNEILIKFYDECSELSVGYEKTTFSDNFNTLPNETISLNFKMDYIGFFKYEQNANLFFKDNNTN